MRTHFKINERRGGDRSRQVEEKKGIWDKDVKWEDSGQMKRKKFDEMTEREEESRKGI